MPPSSLLEGPDAQETVPGLTAVMTLWYTQTGVHSVQEDGRSSVSLLNDLAGLLWALSEVAASGTMLGMLWVHLPPSAVATGELSLLMTAGSFCRCHSPAI